MRKIELAIETGVFVMRDFPSARAREGQTRRLHNALTTALRTAARGAAGKGKRDPRWRSLISIWFPAKTNFPARIGLGTNERHYPNPT